jgi:phage terminase large subunit-like protein
MNSATSSPVSTQLIQQVRLELEQRSKEKRLALYQPYLKQQEFHAAGKTARERLLMAANQVGKTLSAGAEVAMHLSGRYPDYWKGRRYDRAPIWWAAGITGESTRDNPQRILVGRPGEHGTGMIPKALLLDTRPAPHGVADSLDHIKVRHETTGGTSLLYFKSYEKGRAKWQGETLDGVWFDEEPPEDIYSEGLTRTNATGGMAMITFTPLLGMSKVVRRFLLEKPPGTHVTQMTIDDAGHYTPEQRKAIIAAYPAHEREARSKGIPSLGSGRVFPVTDAEIEETSIEIPAHWPRICGTDFGWDHPFAAVWMAVDRDTDTVHVYHCFRVREQTPAQHSIVLNQQGKWIPVAWPHDGLQHDKQSGKTLADHYRAAEVNMLSAHATHPGGDGKGYGFEAGITEMLERMQSGRLKVAKHLNDWWDEFRMYHREDGKVVKEGDDIMSATRIGLMMLRYAATKPKAVNINKASLFGASPSGWMA